jgi:5-hydroxyisourate hydrolase
MSLTTHVLDTVNGCGAAGMRVDVRRDEKFVGTSVLDEGGRASLQAALSTGVYELLFHAGTYLGTAVFYDVIPVRFIVTDPAQHCHVPLILSAYGYSTYRGG